MKNLSQKEWEEKTVSDPNAVIIDVRTQGECADGIIEGAKCLDIFKKDNFLSELKKMDSSKNYYVYCRSGQRSANACSVMENMGFDNVFNLTGGILNSTGKTV